MVELKRRPNAIHELLQKRYSIALLDESIDPIGRLIDVLRNLSDFPYNRSLETEFEDYIEKQDTFLKFFEENSPTQWNSEHEFETAFKNCLNDCALPGRKTFFQMKNTDSARNDIQILLVNSFGYSTRPCFLFELKLAKKGEIDIASYLPQVLHHLHMILGRHCGNAALPFVLMDTKSFLVGLATWSNYSTLAIRCSKTPRSFFKENSEIDTEVLKKLFKFIYMPPVFRKKVFQDRVGKAYKIIQAVGQGSSSTVFRTSEYTPNSASKTSRRRAPERAPKRYKLDEEACHRNEELQDDIDEDNKDSVYIEGESVLKFSKDKAALEQDIAIDGLLQERFRMGWQKEHAPFKIEGDPNYFIVGKYLRPVAQSLFTQAEDVAELKLSHMNGLLDNLLDFHRIGYAHGDVRLPNVFVNQDEKAVLGDFGACVKLDTVFDHFYGGSETASQMVLSELAMSSPDIRLQQADDLESLLKLYLIAFTGANPPETDDPRTMFDYWINYPCVSIFWKLPSNEDKISFLRSCFTVHDIDSFRRTVPPIDKSIKTDIVGVNT